MTHVMIHQDVMDKCRPAFDKEADDGLLDPTSLQECLRDCGIESSPDEIELVIAPFQDKEDTKSKYSGGVSFEMFVLLAMQLTELRSIRIARDEDSRAAFTTLGGEEEGGSVTGKAIDEVLSEFELNINANQIVKEYDKDQKGTLFFREFSAMLAEQPDQKMLSGAFKIVKSDGTSGADEPFYYGGSSPTKSKSSKHDGERSMKKSERANKANFDDNEETDEAKLKKVRKNFNFMNSLHKQYTVRQSGPRSEASRLRTSKPFTSYAQSPSTENRSRTSFQSLASTTKGPGRHESNQVSPSVSLVKSSATSSASNPAGPLPAHGRYHMV
uniref:EF-hand domain-containing protein n=1 Tax=Hemiselmis andersenii TaxID=464988 RepID=A0A6T8IID5_HEMAN|mmetsp:Transcript_4733/g.10897  ORF Transcript_4733/g.10897 Transcript_4733/m.10897 type:complete len:328 (-) Transcript_4733:230-1213(-)